MPVYAPPLGSALIQAMEEKKKNMRRKWIEDLTDPLLTHCKFINSMARFIPHGRAGKPVRASIPGRDGSHGTSGLCTADAAPRGAFNGLEALDKSLASVALTPFPRHWD